MSQYSMFVGCVYWLLVVVQLFLQDVKTDTFFVSHNGGDFDNCGNRTMPCRTVRHAVKMVGDGGQIYIDYAQGTPYMECEKIRQSTYAIQIAKSLSLHGINGKAEITCTKGYGLFNISSPNTNVSSVKFFNLVISNSYIAVRLDLATRSRSVFQNVLIKNNEIAIYSKHSTDCFIVIINSTFENNFSGAGTRLECLNVTAQIISSTFKLTPALFANIGDKPPRWQSMRVLVRDVVIDSKKIQICTDMFAIKLSAAIVNITISDSQIKNHVANCKYRDKISALRVYGRQSSIKIYSHIFLSNVLVENNRNNWFTLRLDGVYSGFVKIVIQDSIFRNNSAALWLGSIGGRLDMATSPTVFLENNTFVDNVYEDHKPNGAAAIYFSRSTSRVSTCRFLDNKAGKNPYTGVITISVSARVTFFDTYFENRQKNEQSNQLFALGNQFLRFVGHTTINLVALKQRQSVFIHIPTGASTGVIVSKNFKILCPQSYKLTQKRFCTLDKTVNVCYYLNVECEQCPTKTYTVERGELIFNITNSNQCQQCPRGGDCDDGLIKAKPNFWGYKTKMKVYFIQCPPGYCCKSKDCTTYDCCCGNRSGTLCGQCSKGMSETLFSTHCISNTKCSLNYFFIFGMTGFVALYLIFFLYHREIVNLLQTSLFTKPLSFFIRRRTDPRSNDNISGNHSSSGGIIKIFFYYYQVCHLIRGSVGPSTHVEIFTSAISRTMNMVIVKLPSFSCPLKNLRPISKAVILHSVGYCLLGLLCILYVLSKLFLIIKKRKINRTIALRYVTSRANDERGASKSPFSKRLASAFTYISLLMYASSAQLSLSLLYCVPVRGDKVLFLDGSIKCYQPFQYFLFAYLISSTLPFCLVPVLGSYLLKFGQIGVKQFCVACIFPLPFCCFWMYLAVKNFPRGNQGMLNATQENSDVRDEHGKNNTESRSGERFVFDNSDTSSAILGVLQGPFRNHHAVVFFPASRVPWEGFLIFRRLALIIVLTFVYDIQLRMFLALTVCVVILIIHTFVHPFQRKRDNILETFSLGTHVVLCASNLIKAFYYGEDYSFSKPLPALNVAESLLVLAPLSVIIIVVIVCIIVKCAFALKACVSLFIRCIRRVSTSI